MRVAIVGAGFAGLSVAWQLAKRGVAVTVFEALRLGAGTSGMSTGLLHPMPAKDAKRSQRSAEAMAAAAEQIAEVEGLFGESVALHTGILRLAMTGVQRADFAARPGETFWDEAEVERRFPPIRGWAGLWLEEGKTLFSRRYLERLWRACEGRGAQWIERRIGKLEELSAFDAVVLAGGHEVLEWGPLPLKAKKGQALVCRFPKELPRLPCSVVGAGHLSLMHDPALCVLGSTYEEEIDVSLAHGLREKIGLFFPPAQDFEMVEVVWGVRIAQRGTYLPYVAEIQPRTWVFSGLGSRGLLYHALYGKELAERIAEA